MEKETLMKIGYEIVIILNALSVILWIFLAIFPGSVYLGESDITGGLQAIFVDPWFLCFVITLGAGIFLHLMLKSNEKEQAKLQNATKN
ncbi:MAG: hypothetical protein HWN65_09020 [Candidatus Helarchaeota archaeon]|nr:hypothetical protein [Candidatus Helarchaeota archaeon]